MTRLRLPILSLLCALGASGVLTRTIATAQTLPGHSMVSPTELKWTAVPSMPPGATVAILEGPMNEAAPFTARLRFPANYRIPAHTHPAI